MSRRPMPGFSARVLRCRNPPCRRSPQIQSISPRSVSDAASCCSITASAIPRSRRLDTLDWYKRLTNAAGGEKETAEFARLFLVPGMNHCSGGPATDGFDVLTPLVAWVEQGRAPERIEARAGATTPWPGRSRPLCPYPRQARYLGSGSIETAESFVCTAP
ncbi:tannase/feruloyl esterase family alpha/beta hydrolase [Bradyrhizobium huanghuaihaiense]